MILLLTLLFLLAVICYGKGFRKIALICIIILLFGAAIQPTTSGNAQHVYSGGCGQTGSTNC